MGRGGTHPAAGRRCGSCTRGGAGLRRGAGAHPCPVPDPGAASLAVIWFTLAALGVLVALVATAVVTVMRRTRALRSRPGYVPVRVRAVGGARWRRGHGLWAHDVFVFRGRLPGAREELLWVGDLTLRSTSPEELVSLRGLGDDALVARMQPADTVASAIEVAARREHRQLLVGAFMDLGTAGRPGRARTGRRASS